LIAPAYVFSGQRKTYENKKAKVTHFTDKEIETLKRSFFKSANHETKMEALI
jgi:hypothetical protein